MIPRDVASQCYQSPLEHMQAFASTCKYTQAHASTQRRMQAFASTCKHSQAHASTHRHMQVLTGTCKYSRAHASPCSIPPCRVWYPRTSTYIRVQTGTLIIHGASWMYLCSLLLLAYGSAAGLDTCFLTSHDLAWSTTCGSVSSLQVGRGSVNLSKLTHHPPKFRYSYRKGRGGSFTTVQWFWP